MLHGSHYLHERRQTCFEPSQQQQHQHHQHHPPPTQQHRRGRTRHLLFCSFSLMTMTRSPLDLLQGGLVLMSCSSLTWTGGAEATSWAITEPSWSSRDGCSSPGHTAGHGVTFTAMMRAKQSAFRSSLRCLTIHLTARKTVLKAADSNSQRTSWSKQVCRNK